MRRLFQRIRPGIAFARWWWVFPGTAAAGAITAAAVAVALPSNFRAESTLVVAGPAPTRELQLTYVELAVSPDVVARAATAARVDANDLAGSLRVVPAPQSLLVRIFITASDKDNAVRMANAVATELPLYLQESGLDDNRSLRLARAASSAHRQGAPLGASAVLGAFAGLALGWAGLRLSQMDSGSSADLEPKLSPVPLAQPPFRTDSESRHGGSGGSPRGDL